MQTRHEPRNVIDTYEQNLKSPTPKDPRAGVYGAIGLLVLMLMLLIATGSVPLYHWET